MFMCLLLSALLLCLTMEAAPLWCLLPLTTVLLQIDKTHTQENDNRCTHMVVRKDKNDVVIGKCIHGYVVIAK